MLQHFHKIVAALLDDGQEEEETGANFSLKFNYSDLYIATNGFSAENRLGTGSVGQVYRGCLRSGTEVAVKVLSDPCAMQGFHDELKVLSRFRHPNLVTLLGWGHYDDDSGPKFLVYELLPGGDVGKRLYRSKTGREPFPWQHRMCVALDAACGLSYMVNSEPKAFHRDIKPSNILLDVYGNAKLADFGLAGVTPRVGQSCLNVADISGTPGYLCPEFVRTGEVTEQSEVYSFGVVVLEMLINELPATPGPKGQILFPLLEAIQPAIPGALERVLYLLDRSAGWLRPIVDEFAYSALRCIHDRLAQRPSFAEIVNDLRRLCQCAGLRAWSSMPQHGSLQMPMEVQVRGASKVLTEESVHTQPSQAALTFEQVPRHGTSLTSSTQLGWQHRPVQQGLLHSVEKVPSLPYLGGHDGEPKDVGRSGRYLPDGTPALPPDQELGRQGLQSVGFTLGSVPASMIPICQAPPDLPPYLPTEETPPPPFLEQTSSSAFAPLMELKWHPDHGKGIRLYEL